MREKVAGRKKAFKAEEMVEAIIASKGFVTIAAKRLGCSRQTVQNYIKKYKSVEEAVIDAREYVDDMAESKLFERISAGDTSAIIFYCKTRLRHRGYAEKLELDVTVDRILDAISRLAPEEAAAFITRVTGDSVSSQAGYGTN